ncbi:Stage IV sporulation protein FA [compost metagenome]
MDVKSNVKKRREERIKQITAADTIRPVLPGWNHKQGAPNVWSGSSKAVVAQHEGDPDPELLWKKGQGRWNDSSTFASGDIEYGGGKKTSFWSMLFVRFVISALLFAAIWGMNRYEPEWAMPIRLFVAEALTKEMDFAAAEAWYEQTFGGPPSFIPIFRHSEERGLKVGASSSFLAPIHGTLAEAFALSLKGIEIIPQYPSNSIVQVKTVEKGRVSNVTRDAITGLTVMIQHAQGYESVYGHLEESLVEKGDWVEIGDFVGSLPSKASPPYPTLYFALKNNDRYIDPTDVITFD